MLNLSNLKNYRGYKIEHDSYGIGFTHDSYDGPGNPRAGHILNGTMKQVIDRIDEIEDDLEGDGIGEPKNLLLDD